MSIIMEIDFLTYSKSSNTGMGVPHTRESPPADNSVKIALPDPRPVVAPRQFVEHKTLQSTQLNQD